MASYCIDMGFDWDSEPKGGYDGYLQIGLLDLDQNKQSSLAEMAKNSTLILNLWDVSESKDSSISPALPSDWLAFDSADEKTKGKSPVSPGQSLTAGLNKASDSGNSGIFGNNLPVWNVTQGGHALSLNLTNDGRYFFTLKVNVTKGSQTKTFGVDPEMIISG